MPFLENDTSGGTKRCVDLNSAYITVLAVLLYNKISIVMDLSNSFGIPKILKNTIFSEKWTPFTGYYYSSIPIWITIKSKYFFFCFKI